VLILTQYRCTVCAKRTHKMEVLGDVGHVESCFGSFGESVSAGAI
jgi:hypothetical protein